MTSETLTKLRDELHHVVEYANVNADFKVEPGPEPNLAFITMLPGGDKVIVDVPWAMDNLRRLPDRTSYGQIVEALSLSHPKIKWVGPSTPPTVY